MRAVARAQRFIYPIFEKGKSMLHLKRQVGSGVGYSKPQTSPASRTNSYMRYSAGQEGDLKLWWTVKGSTKWNLHEVMNQRSAGKGDIPLSPPPSMLTLQTHTNARTIEA